MKSAGRCWVPVLVLGAECRLLQTELDDQLDSSGHRLTAETCRLESPLSYGVEGGVIETELFVERARDSCPADRAIRHDHRFKDHVAFDLPALRQRGVLGRHLFEESRHHEAGR